MLEFLYDIKRITVKIFKNTGIFLSLTSLIIICYIFTLPFCNVISTNEQNIYNQETSCIEISNYYKPNANGTIYMGIESTYHKMEVPWFTKVVLNWGYSQNLRLVIFVFFVFFLFSVSYFIKDNRIVYKINIFIAFFLLLITIVMFFLLIFPHMAIVDVAL